MTDKDLNLKFRIFFKSERLSKGLSQERLAKRIGLSTYQVHKYESGANRISLNIFEKICIALETCPIEVLKKIY